MGNATDAAAQQFSTYYNVQKAAYLQKGSAGAVLKALILDSRLTQSMHLTAEHV